MTPDPYPIQIVSRLFSVEVIGVQSWQQYRNRIAEYIKLCLLMIPVFGSTFQIVLQQADNYNDLDHDWLNYMNSFITRALVSYSDYNKLCSSS